MPINFMDHLSTNTGEIERPPLPPVGHYVFQVSKIPAMDTIGDGNWDVVDFPCIAIEAREDVDSDELAKFGDVKNITMRHRFMFDKNDQVRFDRSMFNLKRFLEEHLGLEPGPLKESLNSAVGQQFVANIQWRSDKNDPEIQYAEIGRTAPVE